MNDPMGAALAEAFEHLPNRDELLLEMRDAANRHMAEPLNLNYWLALKDALEKTWKAQATKALELGLIPQQELDRIERESDARRAIYNAVNN